MDIRKLKNKCDNCKCETDNLYILSIADKAIVLCDNCMDELKDLNNNLFVLPLVIVFKNQAINEIKK